MTQQPGDFGQTKYVSLETFRRSGVAVATPVWIARSGERFYAFSEGKAGKVKRLRHTPKIRLAACDWRGKVSGVWIDGTARVVEEPLVIADANGALRLKYGWQMKFGDFFAKLSGRYARRAMIEIHLAS
ncbi:MAG: PPOX class probable F420-dependent enzyme [Gammaproteobacteria bacterium]|jgi:PPOX class probable F420-dependent enzyme